MAAPRVWNSLPLGVKTNCDSLRGFKTGLKTYLFRRVILLELWRFINYVTYLLNYVGYISLLIVLE